MSTERQFCGLLAGVSRRLVIGLQLFSVASAAAYSPDPNRPARRIDLATLEHSPLDGLIVTGTAPTTPDLRDEPNWPHLARLIDLARERRIPTVFSCLAAHAVAWHVHGIRRRPLPRKMSGLVECSRTGMAHPIAAGLPARWRVPHSRYNELPPEELSANGYQILSITADGGADLFVHERDAPFVFLQGHPEYEARTLLREYHRDVSAFLAGASDEYPHMPTNYLGPHGVALLERFRDQAIAGRQPGLIARFPLAECEEGLVASWRDVALAFWTNWLLQLYPRQAEADLNCRDEALVL